MKNPVASWLKRAPKQKFPLPQTRESIEAARARAEQADPVLVEAERPELFDRWKSGALLPWKLTQAFDRYSFNGDWVDVACGTELGMVDRWEAGTLYPTWAELVRASALTETSLAELLDGHGYRPVSIYDARHRSRLANLLRNEYLPEVVEMTTSCHPTRPAQADIDAALNAGVRTHFPDAPLPGTQEDRRAARERLKATLHEHEAKIHHVRIDDLTPAELDALSDTIQKVATEHSATE